MPWVDRYGDVVLDKTEGSTGSKPQSTLEHLNANQIVYLSQGNIDLYGEVIQVVESRERCWVRPLVIIEKKPDQLNHPHICHQTPQGPDVIWPLAWFTPALDTDWLAILTSLEHAPDYDRPTANQKLRQLWQARQSASSLQEN
jgi:hypothetical protein